MVLKIIFVWIVYLILRDFVFRIFYIYPTTNFKGNLSTDIEENSIINNVAIRLQNPTQVGFVGNSHVLDAINPDVINSITGRSAYNYAHYYLPFSNSLKILIDSDCFPKIIFVDVSTRYSMFSEFYDKRQHNIQLSDKRKIKKNIVDKISFIFPSIFVPKVYRHLLIRGLKKLRQSKINKFPVFSRYSPFSRLMSYRWSLNNNTNHRVVDVVREKSKTEKLSELVYLRKSINETNSLCDRNDPMYQKSLNVLEDFLYKAKSKSSQVVFIRLPLDDRLIQYENKKCDFFFNDIKQKAKRYDYSVLDLNDVFKENNKLDFYSDGQHLTESSAIKVSTYLANYINSKL